MKTLDQMRAVRIVTEQKGSWKWQDAYRIAHYAPVKAENGKILWRAYSHSRKLSAPQLARIYGNDRPEMYSIHNTPVSRKQAIKEIGILRVKSLEGHGWKFGEE